LKIWLLIGSLAIKGNTPKPPTVPF